ncbi:hypothetical protein XU18_3993, partial [Perkinsela sp. CCAP 1560/4]
MTGMVDPSDRVSGVCGRGPVGLFPIWIGTMTPSGSAGLIFRGRPTCFFATGIAVPSDACGVVFWGSSSRLLCSWGRGSGFRLLSAVLRRSFSPPRHNNGRARCHSVGTEVLHWNLSYNTF